MPFLHSSICERNTLQLSTNKIISHRFLRKCFFAGDSCLYVSVALACDNNDLINRWERTYAHWVLLSCFCTCLMRNYPGEWWLLKLITFWNFQSVKKPHANISAAFKDCGKSSEWFVWHLPIKKQVKSDFENTHICWKHVLGKKISLKRKRQTIFWAKTCPKLLFNLDAGFSWVHDQHACFYVFNLTLLSFFYFLRITSTEISYIYLPN